MRDQLQLEPRGVLRVTASVALRQAACGAGGGRIPGSLPADQTRHDDHRSAWSIWSTKATTSRSGSPGGRACTSLRGSWRRRAGWCARRRAISSVAAYPPFRRNWHCTTCLRYTHSGTQGEWRFQSATGEIVVPVKGSLRIDDDDALSQAVLSGLGIALLPTFIVGRELQAGRLLAVLPDYVLMQRRIYAVHLPNGHLPVKVRGFTRLSSSAIRSRALLGADGGGTRRRCPCSRRREPALRRPCSVLPFGAPMWPPFPMKETLQFRSRQYNNRACPV